MMVAMYKKTSLLLAAACFLLSSMPGCARDSSKSETKTTPDVAEGQASLSGTVLQKPWSKSFESWNAGGSEYYVLDVGDAPVKQRSAKEGVILRPSDAISMDDLKALVGKNVEVSGVYVEAKPYKPSQPTEQYPVDIDGKPVPRGSGFQVLSVKAP